MNPTSVRIFAALLLTGAAALAQVPSTIRANIPFEFQVGERTLAPGEYTLVDSTISGAVLMKSTQGNAGVIFFASPSQGAVSERSVLTFNRYGERYFLSAVRTADGSGRELRKGRLEQELTVAKAKPKDKVNIAAR